MVQQRFDKRTKTKQVIGILQPCMGAELNLSAFKLVSNQQSWFLHAPQSLSYFLERHMWESFLVIGELRKHHIIDVRKARIQEQESDNGDGFENFDNQEDLTVYENQIYPE